MKGPIVRKMVKNVENTQEAEKEKKEVKRKVDINLKVATKKKPITKTEGSSQLKVSPKKARSTSQIRKLVKDTKVNEKLAAPRNSDQNNSKPKLSPKPKQRATSKSRNGSENEKPVAKLEVTGKKLTLPAAPALTVEEKAELLFTAYSNWGQAGQEQERGITAYQLTRWLRNVNLIGAGESKVKLDRNKALY